VSVRTSGERGTYNNRVSAMIAELPVGLEDAAGGPLLTLGDLLWLAALPLLGTLLATLVARAAVLRALRSSL